MGKRVSWKDGNTRYDGWIPTNWERLKKLEAKAYQNDASLFALVEAAYEENEISHYMEYVKQAAEKDHPLSLYLVAKDLPKLNSRRNSMLKRAVEGGCEEAKSIDDGRSFWSKWF